MASSDGDMSIAEGLFWGFFWVWYIMVHSLTGFAVKEFLVYVLKYEEVRRVKIKDKQIRQLVSVDDWVHYRAEKADVSAKDKEFCRVYIGGCGNKKPETYMTLKNGFV